MNEIIRNNYIKGIVIHDFRFTVTEEIRLLHKKGEYDQRKGKGYLHRTYMGENPLDNESHNQHKKSKTHQKDCVLLQSELMLNHRDYTEGDVIAANGDFNDIAQGRSPYPLQDTEIRKQGRSWFIEKTCPDQEETYTNGKEDPERQHGLMIF